MRHLLLTLVFFLAPLSAIAIPVSISVEPWKQSDGNFSYSAIHAATSGHERDGREFFAGGAIQYKFTSPAQFLTGDLTDDVLRIDPTTLSLDTGSFKVAKSILDFSVAEGELIGTIDYDLIVGNAPIESGSFYFYHYKFSNGAVCDANGICENGEYRLWGNNFDSPRSDGGSIDTLQSSSIARRGIDLGGTISGPVPEPSAALLFGFGALVAGGATRRR